MAERKLRNLLVGFTAVGMGLGGADGHLIRPDPAGILAGALLGGLVGAGLVLLAWRPRPQDQRTAPVPHLRQPNYFAVWGALFVLTIIEVTVAFLALPKVRIILALVVLAIWKALLVALYYMHLKFEPRRMWVLAASPLPLAVILVMAVLQERF